MTRRTPWIHRTVARAATLLLTGLPLWLAAQTLGTHGLPPEPLLRQALLQAPETDAAAASQRAEQATATQLRLGQNDWVVRAGIAQRSERAGASFNEREIALERTLRWGGKATQDQSLADQTMRLAVLRKQAAWQASATALLAQWFDALRDQQAAWRQQTQLQLAQAQVDALQRRVAAGDAAALLLRQAEGELARTGAAQASAAQRAGNSRQALLGRYPQLTPAWPEAGPATALASQDQQPTSPSPIQDSLTAELVRRQPLLAAAQAELDLAGLQLRRLEADHQADPTVGLRFAQERGGAERVLGLTVSMPFGGALRDSRVQGGQAALAGAEARLRSLQQLQSIEAQRIADAPAQAAHVLRRLQAAAQAADTSTRLTQRAQTAGEATLAELLQQQRQAGDAALAADLAVIDLLQARAQLQLALQQLLSPPQP